jgi:hypothetical protein
VLARRSGAIAIAVVVVIVVVLGLRAYLASQATQALETYNTNVNTLMGEQQQLVAQPFFSSLNGASTQTGPALQTFQQTLLSDSVLAKQEANTAAGWTVPGPMVGAQTYLLEVLDFRWQGLEQIANEVVPALSTGGNVAALREIAGAMEVLNAADVIYQERVRPLIAQQLQAGGIAVASTGAGGLATSGQEVTASQFLPNESWMITTFVATKLLGHMPIALGGNSAGGTNGHQLLSVSAGGKQLTSGQGINPVTYTPGMIFAVNFENDGTNTEYDVVTKVTLSSDSFPAISATATPTPMTQPGQNYTANVVFSQKLPTGTPLRLVATVEPIPGVTNTGANTQSFIVVFN